MPTIVFNGKTYNKIEDMPANERQAFEQMSKMFVDANGNGIPDLLEGDLVKNVVTAHSTHMNINVNGKTYQSFNELPPELRQQVDGAFKMLSTMGFLDGVDESQATAPLPQEAGRSQPYNPPQTSAIEEESGRSTFSIVLISVVLCFAVVAATIAIFVFTNR